MGWGCWGGVGRAEGLHAEALAGEPILEQGFRLEVSAQAAVTPAGGIQGQRCWMEAGAEEGAVQAELGGAVAAGLQGTERDRLQSAHSPRMNQTGTTTVGEKDSETEMEPTVWQQGIS